MYHRHHHRARSHDRQRNDPVRALVHSAHDSLPHLRCGSARAIRRHRRCTAQSAARGNCYQVNLARLFPFRSKERRQRTIPRHYCHRIVPHVYRHRLFERLPRRSRHSVHARHAAAVRSPHRRRVRGPALGHHQRQEEHHDHRHVGHYAGAWIHRPFAVRDFPRPPRYRGRIRQCHERHHDGLHPLSDYRVFQLWPSRHVLLRNRRLGSVHSAALDCARIEHRALHAVPLNLSANGAVRRVAARFCPVHLPSIPYARTRRNRRNQSDRGKRAAIAWH